MPPVVTRLIGANIAAAVLAAQRPPIPSHEVATARNPQPRVPPPTGLMSQAYGRAERMELHLVDDDALDKLEEARFVTWMEAQFNPTELRKSIAPVWNDIVVPGMGRERSHYSHTKSVSFKFVLQFDAFAFMRDANVDPFEQGGVTAGVDYVESADNFICSLGYKMPSTGAPPRCLFYWPNFLSLTAVLELGELKYTGWLQSGHPIRFSAEISLKEIGDVDLARTDVLISGNRRSTNRGVG